MESLLFLVHRIPYPPTKGDKVRSYNVLKYLASLYKVHLGAFVDDKADLQHEGALSDLCETCHLVWLDTRMAKVRSLKGLITGEPLSLPYYHSMNMQRWVNNHLTATPGQRVLVFSAAMAQYVMSAQGSRRVADLVDVDSDKWRQYAKTQSWPYTAIYERESRTLLRYERQIAHEFDVTVFVSAAEAELFRRLAPETSGKVGHVNNGVDCDYFSPDRSYASPYSESEQVLVFTGAMDYWPNVDAVVSFANEVFPAIYAREPAARFYIVGTRPAAEVLRLGALPGVTVTGAVPDIRPYLAHSKVAVAPLRMARGIQNKVLEAMAMGKPIVASPQAAEGIDAQVGKELIVATNTDEFIQHVIATLHQENAMAIGAAGRARVLATYSWESSLSRLGQLLTNSGGHVQGGCQQPGQPLQSAIEGL